MKKKQLLFYFSFEKHHHTKKTKEIKKERNDHENKFCAPTNLMKWNEQNELRTRRKIGECMREKYDFFLVEAHSPVRTINLEEETSLNRNIKWEFSIYTLVIACNASLSLSLVVDTLIYEDCFLHVLHLFFMMARTLFVYMSHVTFLWSFMATGLPSWKISPIHTSMW